MILCDVCSRFQTLFLTIGIVHRFGVVLWNKKRSILHEQPKHAGAARPTCQPDYQWVGGWVTATLKEPVEQIHIVRFIDLLQYSW